MYIYIYLCIYWLIVRKIRRVPYVTSKCPDSTPVSPCTVYMGLYGMSPVYCPNGRKIRSKYCPMSKCPHKKTPKPGSRARLRILELRLYVIYLICISYFVSLNIITELNFLNAKFRKNTMCTY